MGGCHGLQSDKEPNQNESKYSYKFHGNALNDPPQNNNKNSANKKKKSASKTEKNEQEKEIIYVPKVSKFPDRTVCIIGAGPAGIHMASLLIKMGYTPQQIIILEKSDRPCGKSWSIPDPDNSKYTSHGKPNTDAPNHYGGFDVVHEMGTCYLHPEYHIISSLVKEYDPSNIEIPFCAGDVFGTKINAKLEASDEMAKFSRLPFSDWVLTEIKGKVKEKGVPGIPTKYLSKIPHFIAGGAAFEIAVNRYRAVWEEILGKRKETADKVRCFPKKPSPENMQRINCTFFDFLINEKLDAIIPALLYVQSMQGYGILDRIPAFYGLLWTTPELLMASANIFRVARDAANVIVLSKGYEHLWNMMILKHKLNIIYNANVTFIDRDLENNKTHQNVDKNNKLQKKQVIKYKIGQDDDDEFTLEADVLFLACGCHKALDFLTDATEEEKKIFGGISPATLSANLVEFDVNCKNPTHRGICNLFPNNIWKGDDSIYAQRNSLRSLVGNKQYDEWMQHGHLTRDRAMAYQYHTEAPDEKNDAERMRKEVIDILEDMGETNVEILEQKVWDYFPKWSLEDIVENEYPWKVLHELQGKYNKCFYIGSSVCMESVLNVCEYNVELTYLYCFDNDSDVFYCKPLIDPDEDAPFGPYVPFHGIEKIKHMDHAIVADWKYQPLG